LDGALGGISGSLFADPGAGLRWTPRQQRHITLAFHGNVPDGAVPSYLDALNWALSEAAVEPFSVSLAGGGSFGGRTLWAGIGEGEKNLRGLAAVVQEAAAEAGFWPDKHGGARPHVTLARVSNNRGEPQRRSGRRNQTRRSNTSNHSDIGQNEDTQLTNLAAWARALAIYRGPLWAVANVQVVKSELGKGPSAGPLHTEISTIPLQFGVSDNWENQTDANSTGSYEVDPFAISTFETGISSASRNGTYGSSSVEPNAPGQSNRAGARLNYPLKYDLIEAR
jgi:2'-5' RNA ligase